VGSPASSTMKYDSPSLGFFIGDLDLAYRIREGTGGGSSSLQAGACEMMEKRL